ncbi:MAG: hypothetical protein IPG32_13520 [Saprospirales bacterium]|nr:hypothetical protein [Saprospirales bacterium]
MIHFRVGSGIAWIDRTYDRLKQPAEQQHRQPNEQHHLLSANGGLAISRAGPYLRGQFHPFSNGAFQMPNLGINILAVRPVCGTRPSRWKKRGMCAGRRANDRPAVLGCRGIFRRRIKKPVFRALPRGRSAGSLAGIYRISKVQNLLIGGEYEYYQSVFVFSRHTFSAASAEQARREATRRGVFLATEWQFGNTGPPLHRPLRRAVLWRSLFEIAHYHG